MSIPEQQLSQIQPSEEDLEYTHINMSIASILEDNDVTEEHEIFTKEAVESLMYKAMKQGIELEKTRPLFNQS